MTTELATKRQAVNWPGGCTEQPGGGAWSPQLPGTRCKMREAMAATVGDFDALYHWAMLLSTHAAL